MHLTKLLTFTTTISTSIFVLAEIQADKCQLANDKCLNNQKPAIQCNCQLATCMGQDNAQTTDYCNQAMAHSWIYPDAPPLPAATDDCQAKFKQCTEVDKKPQIQCGCELARCSGEDSARNREYCDKAEKNAWQDPDAATEKDCQAKYKQCVTNDGKPKLQCECELATCDGNDSARERDFCSKAENNGWQEDPTAEDCDTKYNRCIGTDAKPKIQCGCELMSCDGGNSTQEEKDYCDRAEKNGWKDPDTPSSSPPPPPTAPPPAGDDCQAMFDKCTEDGKPKVQCECELSTCDGEDSARERDYCDTAEKNGWVEPPQPPPPV